MRTYLAVIIVLLLSASTMPFQSLFNDVSSEKLGSSKATGIDLSVSDVSYSYPNFIDEQKYQMFSSNYPIFTFNRPELLFVVDAVKNVEIEMTVTVDNLGTVNSPLVEVNALILHNEYQNFELFNATNQITTIRGQGSSTTSFKFVPSYSGNHSVIVTPSMSTVDDNPVNDNMMGTFTVASHYFNCDDLSTWTVGQSWGVNSDTSLSEGSACHIGNGQSSTYNPNLVTDLITPTMDMSDAIQNPSRTNGISFYYTGSLASGDYFKIFSMDPANSWTELVSITGVTVDSDFSDSANWQTWSVNNAGASSPLIPSPQQNFHTNSQFRFGFTSDSSVNDIGLWMDDIVIVYDQQLTQNEYGIDSAGLSATGTVANSWGKITIELTNTGNVSESFIPSLSGIPNDWQYYFSSTSGVSITESNGIYLNKGETKLIDLNFQPKINENIGYYPVTFTATSKVHQSVSANLLLQLEVTPDRIPEFLPITDIVRCIPGNSCFVSLSITNAGGAADVFSLSLDYNSLPVGWSVSFAWDQPKEILVQPGFTIPVMLTYSVASDAIPDSVGRFNLHATSQNDSSRTDQLTVEIVASMISDASIYPLQSTEDNFMIEPGGSTTVSFTVTNNAPVQDIFETNMLTDNLNDWTVSDILPQKLFLNSGDTGSFSAKISAPITAQVGDNCPEYFASIISQRSGEVFISNNVDNLQIAQVNNLAIKLMNAPETLKPGSSNEFQLEISNLGNGPVPAEILIDGIPNEWDYRIYAEDELLNDIVQLGEISDFDSIKLITVVIDVPDGVDHSLVYEIKITATPTMYGLDIDTDDNDIILSLVTEIVRGIELSQTYYAISTGIGNSTSINFEINNYGNIAEREMKVLARLYSDTYDGVIIGYMTLGNSGIPYEFNQNHSISLDKNSSRTVRVDLIIPSDIDIGSSVIFDFSLLIDNEQNERLNHRTELAVNYVRDISVDLSQNTPETEDFGSLWLNISTMSSSDEQYNAEFSTPKNWQLICNSALVDDGVIVIEEKLVNSLNRESSTYCEVINLGDVYEGEISISLYDDDNKLISEDRVLITFVKPVAESVNFSTTIITGGVIFTLLTIIIITLLVIKNRTKFDDQKTENSSEQRISGPPISGPPTSNVAAKKAVPVIMNSISQNNIQQSPAGYPPVPQEGLPQGWTLEQWQYYGQQYLDMNRRQ